MTQKGIFYHAGCPVCVAAEHNLEKKAFYELAWNLGAAQGDLAALRAEDIDWDDRIIAFCRKKTSTPSLIRFGNEIEAILTRLPSHGFLFPHLQSISEMRRARRMAWERITPPLTESTGNGTGMKPVGGFQTHLPP